MDEDSDPERLSSVISCCCLYTIQTKHQLTLQCQEPHWNESQIIGPPVECLFLFFCMPCNGSSSLSDINECEIGAHNCDRHATCTNTAGSFKCKCFPGWIGDGLKCSGTGDCMCKLCEKQQCPAVIDINLTFGKEKDEYIAKLFFLIIKL